MNRRALTWLIPVVPVAAISAALLLGGTPGTVVASPPPPVAAPGKYLGASTCDGANCHTKPEPRDVPPYLTEFTSWSALKEDGTPYDRHSYAWKRLRGADKGGDQELEGKLLTRARIFVDDIRQCRTDGEINVPLSDGLITEADIAGEIGEVITGRKPGRTSDEEITLFDSTGIALQDSATVPLEYERAMAAGVGIEKKMIST